MLKAIKVILNQLMKHYIPIRSILFYLLSVHIPRLIRLGLVIKLSESIRLV